MELIKQTINVGNSAGVLLPKEWLNSEVKVVLQPLNIEKDILNILIKEGILSNVLGIYLTGSYARNEQAIESDIDVLVITNGINKRIKIGKYDILLISKKELENKLKKDILPVLPMLKEAKIIINKDLREDYLDAPLNWKNLKWYIETTKERMSRVLEDIEFSKKNKKKVSDGSAYSLILRLRTLYIIDCLRKEKLWKKRGFLGLVKKISGSTTAYERYENTKNRDTRESRLPIKEAEKLRDYALKKTDEIKKWLKERKD